MTTHRYTIPEWLAAHGRRYGLTQPDSVRQQCRRDTVTGGHVCHLPDGWAAEKFGTTWAIYWARRGPEPGKGEG